VQHHHGRTHALKSPGEFDSGFSLADYIESIFHKEDEALKPTRPTNEKGWIFNDPEYRLQHLEGFDGRNKPDEARNVDNEIATAIVTI